MKWQFEFNVSSPFFVTGDEEYLILGCDGLWDTIAPKDVVPIVQEHLAKGGARSEVAKLLVQSAIDHGSTDNVTVVIVYLDCHMKDVKKSGGQEETKPGGDESVDKGETKCVTENEGWEKAEMFRRILLLLMDGLSRFRGLISKVTVAMHASLRLPFQM